MTPKAENAIGDAIQQMDEPIDHVLGTLTAWWTELLSMVPNLIVSVIILALFWLIARVAGSTARRVFDRVTNNPALSRLAANVTKFIVLSAGFFIALGLLQLDKTLTSLLAGAGVVGLALGFAFQNITANFLSGVLLSVRKPFTVGDVIDSNDFFGTVREINLRTTRLITPDGRLVMIPNKEILENPIVNYSHSGQRRVDLEVGVSYGDDLEKAKKVAVEAVEAIEHRIQDREVELFYSGFGASSIDFAVRFWIDFRRPVDFNRSRSEAIEAIKKAFDANDITIPFPIRTLDFGIVGGKTLSEMELHTAGRNGGGTGSEAGAGGEA